MSTLENWSVFEDIGNRFLASELRKQTLQGNVYSDNRFEDGEFIRTSWIIELDIENHLARTRNTTYTLGKPDEKFRKQFPSYFECEVLS